MTARGRGAVVIMTSLTGNQGTPRIAAYAASKAFARVLAESLWFELKGHGIDVVACCAGAVRTPGYALGHGPVVIPGFVNRVATVFMTRLLPRRTAISIMGTSTDSLAQLKETKGS